RLRQTEQNLERVRDIVGEIEPRLAPLAEQAQRAIEYGKLSTELQEVLLSWYALQWRRLRATQQRTERAEQEQAQQVRQLEQSLQALDAQVSTLRADRQQAQARISEARNASEAAHELLQKLERDLAVNEERLMHLEQQRGDIQQEERRLRTRLIAAQKQTIDLEEQCDLADEAVDAESAALATRETQVAEAQKEYEIDERRLRSAQSDLFQVQARLGASQTELGRLQKQLGERNRALATRRDSIAHSQQALRTVEARQLEERAQLDALRDEEQQIGQRKQTIVRAIADAQQEMERLKSTLAEAERQRRSVSDRLNMLKNWRQSLSGYSDGVRTVMRAPDGKLSGLLGPLPQLGVAPAGLEAALEAALGAYMQAVVVQTLPDAYCCLEYLSNASVGKAMVVWLEREQHGVTANEVSSLQAEETVLHRSLAETSALRERVVGPAWQFVQCEQRYVPLFRGILRGIVIVKDVEAAQTLLAWAIALRVSSAHSVPLSSVVTLKGEVFHIDGWLTGGASKDGGQQGLLAYERELRELPLQLDKHKALIEQVNGMFSEVQRAQEGRRTQQMAVEKELQKVTAKSNDLSKIIAASQREQERLQTEIRLAASIEQQMASEVVGLEQEAAAAQERTHTHEKSQRQMAGMVEELQQEMEERARVYRRQRDELSQARTALAVKRQEAKALRQQLTSQHTAVQDLKKQVEQQVARVKETEQRQKAVCDEMTLRRAELEQASERARVCVERVHKAEAQLTDIDQQLTSVEQQRAQTQQAITEQEVVYRRSLLERQRASDAVETLLQQLHEEMGISDPKELELIRFNENSSQAEGKGEHSNTPGGMLSDGEEAQLRRLRRQVDSLRSHVKAIGGCDSNAPREYEELRTRYEFLSTQLTDMEQAALQLRSIIAQLDVSMARQFETTFQAVNARFREHFTTLFNGGTARLAIVDASNEQDNAHAASSMPSGVEVIVQPPGKKVQDLSLLSGGERALVSAALLFALLEINPPPFCLLDEVDAALDETNVSRFCDILQRLAQRTQFIVITHNRVTMTAAQVLYGVSMRESVSRLLSIKLEEVAAAER
ncbi:MAG: AAA family ATPase, partial [Ktedonobacteraceae bacterium]|nr:AAA family ATPase [Ktedonobacteraceae bacterium]